MRAYYFTNEEYGLSNLEKRHIKLARVNELNDPFEFLAAATPEEMEDFVRLKNCHHNWFGLVCFSKNWRNPVQWGHYADKHKGLCLGFDVTNDFLSSITYSEHPITFDRSLLKYCDENSENQLAEEHVMQIINTKYIHWRYEEEVRLFVKLEPKNRCASNGLYFYQFDDNVILKEVIVGTRSSVTKSQITKLLGSDATVAISKARPAFDEYRMIKEYCPTYLRAFLAEEMT